MTSGSMNISLMMRQARQAVSQEDFEKAESLYAMVLEDPEMKGLLDIKTRYAFCVEKVGKIAQAIDLYQEVVGIYVDSGESGAAKALEFKVDILCGMRDAQVTPNDFPSTLDDAIEAAQNDTIDDDISPLDEMDFLSLGDQDLTLFDDEKTQQLEPQKPKHVEVKLTEIRDEPEQNKSSMDSTADMTKSSELHVQAVRVKEKDRALKKLRSLIRHGIRKNKTNKKTEDADIEFTDIGDYELALSNKKQTDTGSHNAVVEKEITKAAEQLFGDTNTNSKKSGH